MSKIKNHDCKKASDIQDKRVKIGQVVKVENTKRPSFTNANKTYYAVWITDSDADNERCWLLTEAEIKRIEHRSSRNVEDWSKRSFWDKILNYKIF